MQALQVALVWHMHQPDYRDPASGQILLPWTYLHAVKDYSEMLRTAQEVPGARLTFNLVPTLLEQLADYEVDRSKDLWLEAARKDPLEMTDEERTFAVNSFFSVHHERHIQPHSRYRELARLRGDDKAQAAARRFQIQDLRDLQVWFLLAWAGHYLRRESTTVRVLLHKGAAFNEGDKQDLLNCYDQVVAEVLQAFRQAEQDGTVELSISPYAHPILPLLCDSEIARSARKDALLPAEPFSFPEDARQQVRYGQQVAARHLGEKPRGVWPAEGAVSAAALTILQQEGALWAASDEAILANSLADGLQDRKQLYRPYHYQGLPLLFRDRELSDRIGFVYARWDPRLAAEDLLERLRTIGKQTPRGLVTLILDGENCWESYADNGYPFLQALYHGLQSDPALQMVTVGEALRKGKATTLSRLAPGSWINGDFDVWIGHHEENTAWQWLHRARRETIGEETGESSGQDFSEPLQHLLRAEGSDWFWWFGDHHPTAQGETFDVLFRHHLQALYRSVDMTVPDYLHQPIKTPLRHSRVHEPLALISPQIDGRISDYFEWLAAGSVELQSGGAMHAAGQELTGLYFGYDEQRFYLRIDFGTWQEELAAEDAVLEIHFYGQNDLRIHFVPADDQLTISNGDGQKLADTAQAAYESIFELALKLEPMGLAAKDEFGLSCRLHRAGHETARWPEQGTIRICYQGAELETQHWFV
jgi:alpha-amylase/alpha-mannosidase (GH57 family)